ncbi:2'-5' RNA ligase family protein [candidate division WOR-3 bacterium]|nr:2'-5' RNA ligase family protein [candidate division WOR-3 bacterium]
MKALNAGESELGIIIRGEASEKIDRWRSVFDPYFNILPPHITLSEIPFLDKKEWSLKKNEIEDVLSGFRTFEVQVSKAGVFTFPEKVLWLKPDDRGEIENIRKALGFVCPGYFKDLSYYIKHITVGFFEEEKRLFRAKNILEKKFERILFSVERISYMVMERENLFSEADYIKL